ncbi:hypothetical protein RB195_025620 [Necator americanus]|uniref:Uncharacterized protein n=1 Tax=Necator americanus TaxID=51031 RepID=A0ABR1ETQ6_NECAM
MLKGLTPAFFSPEEQRKRLKRESRELMTSMVPLQLCEVRLFTQFNRITAVVTVIRHAPRCMIPFSQYVGFLFESNLRICVDSDNDQLLALTSTH